MPVSPFDFGQMYDDERTMPLDVAEYVRRWERESRLVDLTDPEDGFMDIEEEFE
jgi:hypothetical protein